MPVLVMEAQFSSQGLMPHGFCYQWNPALIWLHSISDMLIAIAYFSIPPTLIYLVRKKRSIPFDWMFVCFGVFIAACGATHLMEIVTLWTPVYWLSGGVKVITAFASLPTAFLLAKVVPRVLELPTTQELRESEDRYRDLVENSHDLICTHDLQGRLLSVNDMPAKILGYSREELLNKPMRDFLVPEGRALFDEYLTAILETGSAKGALAVLTKGGERRIWEFHNTLRTDGVATPVVRGIAHDVTERRLAEKAVRLSEEKFSKAFRSSPSVLSISSMKDGRFIDVNEGFERLSGYSRQEIIGHTSQELNLWRDPGERQTWLEEIATHGHIRDREVQFCAKSGKPVVLMLSAEIIELAGQKCLLKVGQDITERKRAEEALRQSEELLRAAFEQVGVGFSMNDLQGRFLKVNEAYCRITGYSEQELLKMDFQSITYPEDLPANLAQAATLLAGKTSTFLHQKRYVRKSGEVVWVQNSVSALSYGTGKIAGFIAFTEDITERKRAEEALQRLSGRLLQLQDEERRKIARDLHDVTGQDLVALSGTLSHLHATISSSSRKARSAIAQCLGLADRCIREVRTLSYLLHPPMLDEAGLEDAIRHYVIGFAERTGIEAKLRVSANFGRLAQEEEMALFRVMQESLVNIHRHSGSFNANVLLDRTPRKVSLRVSDRGRGMQGNGQGKIRGPSRAGGVGIQSMRECMKQVGGQLEIESSADGTTILAVIPTNA